MIHFILQFVIPTIVSIITTGFCYKLGKHDGYDKGYRDGVVFCAKININLIRQMEKKRQEAAAYHKEQEEAAKGSSTGEEKCTSK